MSYQPTLINKLSALISAMGGTVTYSSPEGKDLYQFSCVDGDEVAVGHISIKEHVGDVYAGSYKMEAKLGGLTHPVQAGDFSHTVDGVVDMVDDILTEMRVNLQIEADEKIVRKDSAA